MILALLLLFCILWMVYGQSSRKTLCTSYIAAVTVWTLFLFCVTELLSFFTLLSRAVLFAVWGAFDILLAALLLWQCRRKQIRLGRDIAAALANGLDRYREKKIPQILFDLIPVIIGAGVLFLAIVTVPYNYDSMTYHLPRIWFWAENQSAAYYATPSLRQLSSPVLAEYIGLHIYILAGKTDRLLNLVQTFSYLTGAAMVYAISCKIGCRRFFARLSVMIYMCVPILFAEALTTQVDDLSMMWLLFYVYMILDIAAQDTHLCVSRKNVGLCMTVGLLVGFAYSTKPTVCVAMVIFAVYLLLVCLRRRDKMAEIVKLALCAAPAVLLPILPGKLRNMAAFTAADVDMVGASQLVGTLSPNYLFMSFVKNLFFNMDIKLVWGFRKVLLFVADKLALLLHVDLDSKLISEGGAPYEIHAAGEYHHDMATSPLVVYAAILALVFILCRRRLFTNNKLAKQYACMAAVSFAVFCTVVRWEGFVSRYMTGYLALLCPIVGIALQKIEKKPVRASLAGILVLLNLTEAVNMFIYHGGYAVTCSGPGGYIPWVDIRQSYFQVVDTIQQNGYSEIGLCGTETSQVYPLLAMLRDTAGRMDYVFTDEPDEAQAYADTLKYADTGWQPDCVVAFYQQSSDTITVNGAQYDLISVTENGFAGPMYLFEKE